MTTDLPPIPEPSGDYYDYTQTMQPENPWRVDWHQKYVWRIMHARRGGTGTYSGDPEMAAKRPSEQRYVFGDGRMTHLYLDFEDSLEAIKRVHDITGGVPQIVLLTGWQYEGHDSKYPAWGEVNRHLKRPQDETARESLRWLIREARKYNCLATLHINMFDAYADSPLFEEYLEKDIIAREKDGKPIIGNRWWGMDCYHVNYTQEWKHGLAQKRIDDLITMVPELVENQCIYLDAFLGARMKEQQGPISPYLGYSKEEEARTQRKILRYWYQRGIDPACEHVVGMRVDRFVGLQAHSACQGELIEDLPDELYSAHVAHFGFESNTEPEGFHERFWLEFLPYFYKNHPVGCTDFYGMFEGTDICMPALWRDQPTLIAYSKTGMDNKAWTLPESWSDAAQATVSALNDDEPQADQRLDITKNQITLTLDAGRAVAITPAE